MHKILVIRLYFLLNALHVYDYISPSSGATFYKLYITFGICWYVWLTIATQQPDISVYTKCNVQLIKSCSRRWTNTVRNIWCIQWKIKSNYNNFVHLVGLYMYCKMMHGTYNVILCVCYISFPCSVTNVLTSLELIECKYNQIKVHTHSTTLFHLPNI